MINPYIPPNPGRTQNRNDKNTQNENGRLNIDPIHLAKHSQASQNQLQTESQHSPTY